MTEKKTLRMIVRENWNDITKNLQLDIENREENTLLLLSHLKPYLESAAKAFPLPSLGLYSSVKDIYKKDMLVLEKMGFVETGGCKGSYGLTIKGIDLMNSYHKSKNPNSRTYKELIIKNIIENGKSF
ncbi:MAG: hypothetical protein ACP5NW_01150 [Candidatus Woesearchaeota archaeon]